MFWRFFFLRLLLFQTIHVQTKKGEPEASEPTVVTLHDYKAWAWLFFYFFPFFFLLAILVKSLYVADLQILPFYFTDE